MNLVITKRNGQTEDFDRKKIIEAIRKAFLSVGQEPNLNELNTIAEKIEKRAETYTKESRILSVEDIQDLVEVALIDAQYHDVLKSFILYRNRHEQMRMIIENYEKLGFDTRILDILKDLQTQFSDEEYSLSQLYHKVLSFYRDDMSSEQRLSVLIKASLELTSQTAPKWEFISARFLRIQLEDEIYNANQKEGISSYYDKLVTYTKQGLFGEYLLKNYSKDDIDALEKILDNTRDHLFSYSALNLLYKRYLVRTYDHKVIETPQEMFLGIAMHLAIPETKNRNEFIKDLYDVLSKLKVTMATPTMSNARKPHHQLSSCFIDTVDDSLVGIYKSINNFAQVSKSGGGMGLYFGKVRANGSDIRGFKGVAGGVIRWVKLANDTAVAVDQLGVRQGAVAVYLDVWHKDLPEFLQLKTNNGDDRTKAHDVFPGICFPDLFWRLAKEDINSTWYMMCPHEVLTIKGYALEDYYGQEWEDRYFDCVYDKRISKRQMSVKDLVRLIIKSVSETGTPFTFNRDTINELNPNKHKGMIYSSNLCTEIMQNMSAMQSLEQEMIDVNGETVVVERTIPGDFVVCNLASLILGNIDFDNPNELPLVINTTVRALDNVIDLNKYPLLFAKHTNQAYRAIGLGASGYHHLLTKQGIPWESEAHIEYVDKLFERINYLTIDASRALAKEKGSYDFFNDSDWQTGEYFDLREYKSEEWQDLKKRVNQDGMRNSYLLAVAPTSTTSIIAGTTAGIDPIMDKYFLEEKKGDIVPRVAPDLSPSSFWLYKSAHTIDQHWSIKACGARQRHIDQSQSFNLYITTENSMREILELYIHAWEEKLKSIYYIRSKALEVEECESCSS